MRRPHLNKNTINSLKNTSKLIEDFLTPRLGPKGGFDGRKPAEEREQIVSAKKSLKFINHLIAHYESTRQQT